uniref:site-specific integrase n=1 Tax=uncultured Bacteroides sp. TaxID=162156 RepID=UPI0026208F72
MNKIHFRLVYNRKKKLNKYGEALIQVEVYQNRKKIYISTGIYVNPQQWDTSRNKIIHHPHAEELNRMLEEFILELQWEELKYWKRGIPISLSVFRKLKVHSDTGKMTFLHFGRNWVEQSSRKENTKKNLLTTLDLLNHFHPSIGFEDITYSFLQDFENFMHQKFYETNTIAKHMRQLRTFVNEAIKRGYMMAENYPFRNYQIKTIQSKHTFLLPEEIRKLEQLNLSSSSESLTHSLKAFLFCCYTGVRYSDFIRLNEKNIVKLKGGKWLMFKTVKTDTEVSIPLYLLFQGKALLLLQEYKQDLNSFFRLKSNSSVNSKHSKKCTFYTLRFGCSF